MNNTTFLRIHFTRMDDDRKMTLTASTMQRAQDLADMHGRQGWVLKDIVPTELTASVSYQGKTYFEEKHGLGAKRAWCVRFNDGDVDYASTKRDALAIAKARTSSVTAYTKADAYAYERKATR